MDQLYNSIRIRDMEKEIAKLTRELSNSIDMEGHEKAVDSLIANIELLREAFDNPSLDSVDTSKAMGKIFDSTPSQSLAKHNAEVIRTMLNNVSILPKGYKGYLEFHCIRLTDVEEYADQLEDTTPSNPIKLMRDYVNNQEQE